ncbi:MAG: hypothetical protein DWQ02_15835 [Bacteroidetes bacterium]|nr:MAG: hypothetical protein DWQ02_15835 [Bacteroidota bacterium]
MKKQIYLLFFFSLITISIAAQTPTSPANDSIQYVQIKTLDGNTYIGSILEETSELLLIKTQSAGEIKITKNQIKKLKRFSANQLKDGKYWFENPNATRNLYGPTGYGLEKGEGYYQNFMIFLNSVNVGITDNITIGAGFLPVGLENGFNFLITPKFSVPVVPEKVNLAGGLLYARFFEENMGILYGVGTYGPKDHNATLGLGYGFLNGELAKRPIITVSGMTRVGRKFGLVTENWFIPIENYEDDKNYFAAITYGVRYISEGVTIDFSFLRVADIEDFFILGIPLVGVVIPFGRN